MGAESDVGVWAILSSDKAMRFGVSAPGGVGIARMPPPVGMNVHFVDRLAGHAPMEQTFRGIAPFLPALFPILTLFMVRLVE